MLRRSVCFLLFYVLSVHASMAAELRASVDTSQIAYGETIDLRLQYDGSDGNSLQPDLSVLQKDFAIYSTSSSMNTSIINGVASQKREWLITLLPQNEGKLTIPSIKAGNYESLPIDIEVLSADKIVKRQNTENSRSDTDLPVFDVDLRTDNDNPYVEQEITAVLTVSDNRNLQLTGEPVFENADDWIIKSVGRPQKSRKDGINTTKFFYALSAKKNGVISLPQAVVEGYYVTYDNSPQRGIGGGLLQFFDMDMTGLLGVQKPVLIKSKPQNINIKSIPIGLEVESWVPAEALTATAEWVDKNPIFKVGETVTREIAITALGIAENQLPQIEFMSDAQWKQYPDKPQYTSAVHNNRIISQETIRVVYIPQKSGKMKVPEIKVPWFNVKTHKIETATLPGEEVDVEANQNYEIEKQEPADEAVSENSAVARQYDDASKQVPQSAGTANDCVIYIASVIAFLSGLLISSLLFGKRNSRAKDETKVDYARNVKQALKQADYRMVRDYLVKWGQSNYQSADINNLKDLEDVIDNPEFSRQCSVLNAILYGNSGDKLDEKVIMTSLKQKEKSRKKEIKTPLPDLYK